LSVVIALALALALALAPTISASSDTTSSSNSAVFDTGSSVVGKNVPVLPMHKKGNATRN
jgi:hypothetical protein